nr:nucleotidyltransferase family protein [uncultured Sulfitobacter sp.]
MVPILILAAGSARRMQGRDKLLEDVDGTALLRRTVQNALAVTQAPVFVTLPPCPHPRAGAIADLNARIVEVPDAASGMNASIAAGLGALPATAHAVMIVLADMPDLTRADLRRVLDAVDLNTDSKIWRATTATGEPGHPIVFRSDIWPHLRALRGDTGARDIVRQLRSQTVWVPLPGNHARTDLDTPEAWAAWRANRRFT